MPSKLKYILGFFAALVVGGFLFTGVHTFAATCTGTFFGGTGICYPNTFTQGQVLITGNNSLATTSAATNGQLLQFNGTTWVPATISTGATFGQSWEINGSGALSPTTTLPISVPSTATSTIGNLGGVLDASVFAGADIGAKINAAYAALPSTGGTITIPSGNYSFSTEIVFNVSGKNVTLDCNASGLATVLTWTGSGTSTVFNTAPANSHPAGWGTNNCTWVGPDTGLGGTSVGIEVGGSIGGTGFTMSNTNIHDFDKDFVTGNNTYEIQVLNSFLNLARHVYAMEGITNAGEEMRFTNTTFADGFNEKDSFANAQIGQCVYIPTSAAASLNITGGAIDDCNLYIGDGNLSNILTGVHFENPGVTSGIWKQYTFMTNIGTNGFNSTSVNGGVFLNDASTTQYAPNQYILNNGRLHLYGVTFDQSSTGVPAAAVNNYGNTAAIEANGLAKIGSNSAYGVFATSGTQFIIDNPRSGRVGIGTSSPISLFTVSGAAPTITSFDTTGNQRWDLFNGGNKLRFTNGVVDIFTLLNGGNVGAGSTTPWKLLSVGSNNAGTFAISTSTGGCAQFSSMGELYSTGSSCGSGSGTVTSVTATYPILSTGGNTPVISTAFGTTTGWGIGNNGFLITGPTGIPFVAASSTLNLPNASLLNSSVIVNGTTFNLGDSKTITAASSSLLTDVNTFTNTQTFTKSPIFSTLGAGAVSAVAAGTLYTTATSTIAAGSGLSYTGTFGSEIGGGSGTLSVSGLTTTNFASANVSQFTNDAGYLTSATASGYPFALAGNATSTLTQFNGGLTAYASSTIGNGTQGNGLFIAGGATTTGTMAIGGQLIVGNTNPASTTNAITIPFGATGIGFFNTVDQTTNFAKGFLGFTGNQFTLQTSNAGTGALGSMFVGDTAIDSLIFNNSANPKMAFNRSSNTASSILGITATNLTGNSGTQYVLGLLPTVANTSTGGYTALLIQPTETTLGTGAKYLIQAGTSSVPNLFDVTNTGLTGVGSSSPFARLGIQANNGDITRTLFAIGSSTQSATTTLFSVENTGHKIASSTAPTLSSCGTAPFMTGDDSHGYVTVGSVAATGCTITFAQPYRNRPECTVENETGSITNIFSYTVSATAITVSETGLANDILDYSCEGF